MISDADVIRRARMRVAEKITDLIGDTPIVRLHSFERDTPGVEIWAKCEFFNPGGSVKDRAAYQMIRDAIRTGALKPGQTIIDSTSGNTGVAYSLIGGAQRDVHADGVCVDLDPGGLGDRLGPEARGLAQADCPVVLEGCLRDLIDNVTRGPKVGLVSLDFARHRQVTLVG